MNNLVTKLEKLRRINRNTVRIHNKVDSYSSYLSNETAELFKEIHDVLIPLMSEIREEEKMEEAVSVASQLDDERGPII